MISRSAHPRARGATLRKRVERFFLAPARATPLAALRIGIALVLLGQAALIAPAYSALYERSGLLQGPIRDGLARPGLPYLGWLIHALAKVGIAETSTLTGVGIGYVVSLVALLLGFRTRLFAALAWLTHLALMMTANSTNYGADNFGNMFLFYLVFVPSGNALSLDRRAGRTRATPSSTARLSLRTIQLHLCMVYLSSGVQKAEGAQWWSGDAIWRSVMLPGYAQYDLSWLAGHPWIAQLSGWVVIVVQIGYSIMIWHRATRGPWIVATVAMHVGIAFFMGLGVFGAVMVALTVAAFGVSAEPHEDRPLRPAARRSG